VAAVLLLARRALVRRGRSAIAIATLLGVIGAVVLASAAGAHRSATSLQRFVEFSRSSDVELDLNDPTPAQLDAFRNVPEVADFAVLHAFALVPRGKPNLKNAATIDGRLGTVVDRARLVAGRFANPNAVGEIAIGEGLAAQQHLAIGDDLDAQSITPAQLALSFRNKNPGPPAGPVVRLRIVGIYRRPLDLGNLAASGGVVIETPAFDRAYTGRIGLFATILRVRTRNGAADVPRVSAAARRVFGSHFSSASDVSAEAHGGSDAINLLTLALSIFAGVVGLAGAVALAIVLSRDISQAAFDPPTLAALGLTHRQRAATLGPRVAAIGIGGLVIAVVLAVAASPMFPIGLARRAEPSPGVRFDPLVVGLGAVILTAFVALIGFGAASWTSRLSTATLRFRPRRHVSELAAKSGLGPAATGGLRMALEPGRGARAVPVRSAFLGAVFGVVGLTALLVFSSSLGHLDASPRLYGWTWDFKVADDTFTPKCGPADYQLGAVPGVASVAAVCDQQGVPIDDRPTTAWGFTPVRGSIEPEVVAGSAPSGPTEIALGAATMHALGKTIGDSVQVRGPKAGAEYRIVGQVVLPPLQDGEIQPLADGAVFTGAGLAPFIEANNHTRYLMGDYTVGADRGEVNRRIETMPQFKPFAQDEAFVTEASVSTPTRPPEVERLRGIDWFPPILTVVLAALALIAVGHALVTTAHRRRFEFAILKTLGFERRQVRATVAWQATTLAIVGIAVGIPVGAVVGTTVWHHIAQGLGISPAAVIPAIALALTVPCVLALVNLVAFWPARTAARTRPAEDFVTE
jgi:hypothetical protein